MNFSGKDWIFLFISLAIAGLGMFQPISQTIGLLLILIGLSGALSILCISFYRTRKDRLLAISGKTDGIEEGGVGIFSSGFPPVTWLTVRDVMKMYDLSTEMLKQHIENGLPGYIKNPENQELRPITERDLIALEVWSDESDSMVELWRFKTEDVEKYIKKVGWLTGKEVIDKHDIGAIELYQHIKNGLNIYPKDFSTVMLADHAQPLSKYDIGFEIEYDMAHSDEVYNIFKDYHFKVCDVEKYGSTGTGVIN